MTHILHPPTATSHIPLPAPTRPRICLLQVLPHPAHVTKSKFKSLTVPAPPPTPLLPLPSPLTLPPRVRPYSLFHPVFFLSPSRLCFSSGPLCSYLCSDNLNEKKFLYIISADCTEAAFVKPQTPSFLDDLGLVRVDTGTKGGPQEGTASWGDFRHTSHAGHTA